jgi:hypothetical protein
MLLPEEHEDEKSAELARRLREAGSITSSHLPAGFCTCCRPWTGIASLTAFSHYSCSEGTFTAACLRGAFDQTVRCCFLFFLRGRAEQVTTRKSGEGWIQPIMIYQPRICITNDAVQAVYNLEAVMTMLIDLPAVS